MCFLAFNKKKNTAYTCLAGSRETVENGTFRNRLAPPLGVHTPYHATLPEGSSSGAALVLGPFLATCTPRYDPFLFSPQFPGVSLFLYKCM